MHEHFLNLFENSFTSMFGIFNGRVGLLYLGIHYTIIYLFFRFLPATNWHEKENLKKSFFTTVFPSAVYKSRTFYLDLLYAILFVVFIGYPLWSIVANATHRYVQPIIDGLFSSLPNGVSPTSFCFTTTDYLIWGCLYGFFVYFLRDGMAYFYHRLLHDKPLLWAFHRVHHSALQITLLSAFRSHFVIFIIEAFALAIVGMTSRTLVLTLLPGLGGEEMLKLEASYMLTLTPMYIVLMNLRHLHVRISYGRFMDLILVSPAYHHIHHAKGVKPKNLARLFPIWDIMFGTHLAPSKNLEYEIGISEGNVHDSLSSFIFEPFKYLMRIRTNKELATPSKNELTSNS